MSYNEGDLIEAVNGDTVIRGRVTSDDMIGIRHLTDRNGISYHFFPLTELAIDYTLTVIERAKPALPTEPGLYRLNNRIGNGLVVELMPSGDWLSPNHSRYMHENAKGADSFERLEPAAETAKKVLDALVDVSLRITGTVDSPYRSIYDDNWDAIATEFGVTGGLGE